MNKPKPLLWIGGVVVIVVMAISFFMWLKPEAVEKVGQEEEDVIPREEVDSHLKRDIAMHVPTDKVWELHFTENLDASSVEQVEIIVTDRKGENVPVGVTLTNENKTISIEPNEPYTEGMYYELHVGEGLRYETGEDVEKTLELTFITDREDVMEATYNPDLKEIATTSIEKVTETDVHLLKDDIEEVTEGDILLLLTDDHPEGEAIKVSSVEEVSDAYLIKREEPLLEEVFQHLNIHMEIPVTANDFMSSEEVTGYQRYKQETKMASLLGDEKRAEDKNEFVIGDIDKAIVEVIRNPLEVYENPFPLEVEKGGKGERITDAYLTHATMHMDFNIVDFQNKGSYLIGDYGTYFTLHLDADSISSGMKAELNKGFLKSIGESVETVVQELQTENARRTKVYGKNVAKFVVKELFKTAKDFDVGVRMVSAHRGDFIYNGEMATEHIQGFYYGNKEVTPINYTTFTAISQDIKGNGIGMVEAGAFANISAKMFGIGGKLELYGGGQIELGTALGNVEGIGETSCQRVYVSPFAELHYQFITFEDAKRLDFKQPVTDTCNQVTSLEVTPEQVEIKAGEFFDIDIKANRMHLLMGDKELESVKPQQVTSAIQENASYQLEYTDEGIRIRVSEYPSQEQFDVELRYLDEQNGDKAYTITIPVTITNFKDVQDQQTMWEGKWVRNVKHQESELTITNVTGNSLALMVSSIYGAHYAEAEGTASVTGNTAHFDSTEYTCVFDMVYEEETITLIQETSCGENAAGFDGEYVREEVAQREEPADLVSLGVLSAEQDEQLRDMVGGYYQSYVDNMMVIERKEARDGYLYGTGREEDGSVVGEMIIGRLHGSFVSSSVIVFFGHGGMEAATVLDHGEKVVYHTSGNVWAEGNDNEVLDASTGYQPVHSLTSWATELQLNSDWAFYANNTPR